MATTEVAEALESLDFLQEVNVYGVTVPGAKTREVGGSQPAALTWYYLGPGSMKLEGGPPQQLTFPPHHQGTRAELEWQPWFCVPPTLWTLCGSTPMFLRTCRRMPGLDS